MGGGVSRLALNWGGRRIRTGGRPSRGVEATGKGTGTTTRKRGFGKIRRQAGSVTMCGWRMDDGRGPGTGTASCDRDRGSSEDAKSFPTAKGRRDDERMALPGPGVQG